MSYVADNFGFSRYPLNLTPRFRVQLSFLNAQLLMFFFKLETARFLVRNKWKTDGAPVSLLFAALFFKQMPRAIRSFCIIGARFGVTRLVSSSSAGALRLLRGCRILSGINFAAEVREEVQSRAMFNGQLTTATSTAGLFSLLLLFPFYWGGNSAQTRVATGWIFRGNGCEFSRFCGSYFLRLRNI